MFELYLSKVFLKKAKKLVKKDKNIEKLIAKTTSLLEENPDNPVLHSHKVIMKNGDPVFSSRVNSDLRIIWDYSNNIPQVLDLIDIGGHSGKNKVYK